MQKKFEINQTKIKGGCPSERKVVNHNSKSDLPPTDSLDICWVSTFKIGLFASEHAYLTDSISDFDLLQSNTRSQLVTENEPE